MLLASHIEHKVQLTLFALDISKLVDIELKQLLEPRKPRYWQGERSRFVLVVRNRDGIAVVPLDCKADAPCAQLRRHDSLLHHSYDPAQRQSGLGLQ